MMYNFIVSNDDVVVKFSCANHRKRIEAAVGNLMVANENSDELKCSYMSNDSEIEFDFDNEKVTGKQVRHQAVFFENTDYPLIAKGKHDKLETIDMFVTGRRRSDTEKNSGIIGDDGELYGTLNFNNQIGKTDFTFKYHLHGDAKERELSFSTEVLSYKLDYRSDLKTIISDIENEYAMLSFSFLRDTYQNYKRGSGNSSELIWWNIFHSCFNEIVENTKIIINRPKKRLRSVAVCERAERMTTMPVELENEYLMHKDNPAYLYRTEMLVLSHDTVENRFLKYAVLDIYQKFIDIRIHIKMALNCVDYSSITQDLDDMEEKLVNIVNHPFFKGIGRFKGFSQDSLVMKQSVGYRTILEKWIELLQGYEIAEGMQKLEVKDISDLYEIWCFIIVKNIVAEVLAEKQQNVMSKTNGKDVTSDFIPKLIYGGSVSFIQQDGIELVSVSYNAEIEQHDSHMVSSICDAESFTTVQRPDIVLRLSKDNDTIKYTYLFDAKYRISDSDVNGHQVPPPDAIDQLHRYRDSIYYSRGDDIKKEIVSGYVLFPGNVPYSALADGTYYYQQSNNKIGIGAFPLKPNKENGEDASDLAVVSKNGIYALKEQIRLWLDNDDNRQLLLKQSIPQKGLEYKKSEMGVAMVMMERYNEKINKFLSGKVAIPLLLSGNGKCLVQNMSDIKFVMFHTRNKTNNKHLFKLRDNVQIMEKESAEQNGYYLTNSNVTHCLCIDFDIENELVSTDLNPSKDNLPYDSKNERYLPQYTTLDKLMKK